MQDLVALVTGASSGIGEALAERLGRAGARVVVTARRADRLEKLAERARGAGGKLLPAPADIVDDAQCAALVRRVVDAHGKLDLLVLNAGVSTNARVQDLRADVARRVMEVNYHGSVQLFLHALPHLIASRGQVIVVSSLAGKKGLPTRAAYCASKFALHGFFDAARLDLHREGVRVLLACPGFVDTEVRKHALRGDGAEQGFDDEAGRAMQTPDECAAQILEAARAGRRELVMGGFAFKLLTRLEPFAPSLVDRAVLRATARREAAAQGATQGAAGAPGAGDARR